MSADGCQQCGLDQYSAAGATSCTPCPEGLLSLRGSVSVDDCYNGECRVFTEIVVFSTTNFTQFRDMLQSYKFHKKHGIMLYI